MTENSTTTNQTTNEIADTAFIPLSSFQRFVESLPDATVLFSPDGDLLYLNPAFTELFGWTATDFNTSGPQAFIPPENRQEYLEKINEVRKDHPARGKESYRTTKTGHKIKVSMSAAAPSDPTLRTVGRIETYRQVRQSDRDKFEGVLELAGAVCHELSQPAMIIEGYADLFLLHIDKGDPLFEKMEKLKKQVARISDLTQKLMKVTKYETVEYSKGKTIVDIHRSAYSPGEKS